MKRFIYPVLTLTILGFTGVAASAGEKEAQVNGDSAIIQSVEMKVDQYGEGNRAVQSGEVYNRIRTGNRDGSTGIVQTGNVNTVQTGEGNDARSRFRIENTTEVSSPRRKR